MNAIETQLSDIIGLATANTPSPPQLAGWEAYVNAGGSMESVADAFIASSTFANLYNHGTPVDPHGALASNVAWSLIQFALDSVPTSAQVNGWLHTGLSTDQVFMAFATGDQFAGTVEQTYSQYSGYVSLNGPVGYPIEQLPPPNLAIVTGDLTGATTQGGTSTSGIEIVGINTQGSPPIIEFNNAATETFLSSQVNVTPATSLAQALDIAAADASASQSGGAIPGDTGVIDWFQYGGNTYLVEDINSTSAPAEQTALTTTDAAAYVVGILDLSAAQLTGPFLTI
jgi:hypothetical protein